MPFTIQHGPSAQSIGSAAYAGGLGQYYQKQQELAQRERMQVRALQANQQSQFFAQQSRERSDQIRMAVRGMLAERQGLMLLERERIRDRFNRDRDTRQRKMQLDIQDRIMERAHQDNQNRIAVANEKMQFERDENEVQFHRDSIEALDEYINSVPNWDQSQQDKIAVMRRQASELMERKDVEYPERFRMAQQLMQQFVDRNRPRGEVPKTDVEILDAKTIRNDEDGMVGWLDKDGIPKWMNKPQKKQSFESPADYAKTDIEGYGKLLTDIVKATAVSSKGDDGSTTTKQMSAVEAARFLHEAHQETMRLGAGGTHGIKSTRKKEDYGPHLPISALELRKSPKFAKYTDEEFEAAMMQLYGQQS